MNCCVKYFRALLLSFFAFAALSAAEKHEGVACKVFFSPDDQIANHLIQRITEEQESIYIAIYCFTHQEIAKALIAAKERGVYIEIIVDPYSLQAGKAVEKLSAAGLEIYVWDPPKKKAPLMHDKFCVFGSDTVWTGSFNFTYEANKSHQENVVLLTSRDLAATFQKQFELIKKRGCTPYKSYTSK